MSLIITILEATPIKHPIKDNVFMYVSQACPHTIPACQLLRCCKHLQMVDIDSGHYLVFENNELKQLRKAPADLLKAFHFETVPQVFTRDTKWYYIGGYEDLKKTHVPSAPPVVEPDNNTEDNTDNLAKLPVVNAVPVAEAEPVPGTRALRF